MKPNEDVAIPLPAMVIVAAAPTLTRIDDPDGPGIDASVE